MKLDLNALRAQCLRYLEKQWQPQFIGGGFSDGQEPYVSLMGTTDAGWLCYLLQAKEEIAAHGHDAALWLKNQQLPDGHFHHNSPNAESTAYRHSDGHAYWMTVRALHIFGEPLTELPAYQLPFLSAEVTDRWFAGIDWQSKASNHHDVLGLIPVMCRSDAAWATMFFDHLAAQQDPAVCAWCDNLTHTPNISRTFAYVAMYLATGRIPPHADALIETVIRVQRESGIWELRQNTPEFHTMDASYILWRLGNAIDYPLAPRLAALQKAADAMNAYLASRPIEHFAGTHLLLGNMHTLGLLSEALPERYESDIPWLFGWDDAAMFA